MERHLKVVQLAHSRFLKASEQPVENLPVPVVMAGKPVTAAKKAAFTALQEKMDNGDASPPLRLASTTIAGRPIKD
jgi:hypothetical protein